MNHFILDGRYEELLKHYGIDVSLALRIADLPERTFEKIHPVMTEQQYYDFMRAIGEMIDDPFLPIQIATTDQIETFAPPIFAAYSSRNGEAFIKRLAQYKKLIGPMTFSIREDDDSLTIELAASSKKLVVPEFLALSEFAFLVGMIRRASQKQLSPLSVAVNSSHLDNLQIRTFFACRLTQNERNQIVFDKGDLQEKFISSNQSMLDYFEPELNKRLAELEIDTSVSAQVRSSLTELLPSGEVSIDDVAKKMGYSKRTLQRKLKEEKTTFQKQLNSTREILAVHYLRNTEMTTSDIAYLLGYQELNSFLRAFTIWKGMSVSEYRKQLAE